MKYLLCLALQSFENCLLSTISGEEPSDFVREGQNTAGGTELCQTFTNGGLRQYHLKVEKLIIFNAGTCALFTTALRIFTKFSRTERRLTVEPGLGMASLSQQGVNITLKFSIMTTNLRKGGILFLGQKQGEIGGEFIARQAWSGKMSQFNIWSWPLEDFYIENAAECRSDLVGNMVSWKLEDWTLGPSVRTDLCMCLNYQFGSSLNQFQSFPASLLTKTLKLIQMTTQSDY